MPYGRPRGGRSLRQESTAPQAPAILPAVIRGPIWMISNRTLDNSLAFRRSVLFIPSRQVLGDIVSPYVERFTYVQEVRAWDGLVSHSSGNTCFLRDARQTPVPAPRFHQFGKVRPDLRISDACIDLQDISVSDGRPFSTAVAPSRSSSKLTGLKAQSVVAMDSLSRARCGPNVKRDRTSVLTILQIQ
jgi:hypothetical protein